MNKIQFKIFLVLLTIPISQCVSISEVNHQGEELYISTSDTIVYSDNLKKGLLVPEGIKVIKISQNFFSEDSLHFLSNFVNAHTIEVFATKLDSLPDELMALNMVQTIRLRQNKNLNINQALSVFSDCIVKELGISSSNLKMVPSEVYNYRDLIILDLENNEIASLDDSLFLNLQKLEMLNVGKNEISCIGPEIMNLERIKEINFVSNPLRTGMSYDYLDSLFLRLPVEHLNLTSCGFTEFPRFIEGMCCLKSLLFLNNTFANIPEDLDLTGFNGQIYIDRIDSLDNENMELFYKKYSGKIVF